MKIFKVLTLFLLVTRLGYGQLPVKKKSNKKLHSFYFYWGWNRDQFSKSDIHFKGHDYNFTLYDVKAHDRQSSFNPSLYLNPATLTYPQYNFRIGYFLRRNYNISFGIDHMKYVMTSNQVVKISGHISETETIYDGVYSNDDITLSGDFLKLEHTDGLNYVNVELRRTDELIPGNIISVSLTEGMGGGFLYPRTDATLMNNAQYDQFHLAGMGIGGVVGLNIEFFNTFFIQSEVKGGVIYLTDVRTTNSRSDKASQQFYFSQFNIVLGTSIRFKNKPVVKSSL